MWEICKQNEKEIEEDYHTWKSVNVGGYTITVMDDATCAASLYSPLTLTRKWNSSVNNVEKI
jgi:hypothetical protein